jgi:hypothetical protein
VLNKYGQPKYGCIRKFLKNYKIIGFEPFKIKKLLWTHTQSRLDIFGVVKKLVKIKFIYVNIKI